MSGLKEKVHYLDSLRQLLTCMRPEEIDIPPFVLDYDARVSIEEHSHAYITHLVPPKSSAKKR